MECTKVLEILADYAVGGLDESTARQVCGHVERCPHCRTELRALQNTAAVLAPMEEATPPPELWSAIERRLQPRQADRPGWQVYLKPLVAAAAVGAVLMAVIVLGPSGNGPAPLGADLPVLAGAEGTSYAETQIAAAWDQPLADEASLALAMATIEPVEADEVIQ